MSKRFVLAALIAASLLQTGCCFRRGCNKCNASAPPPVAYYAPPPPPCP